MGFAIPLDKWFKDKNSRSFFNQIFFETDWEKIGYEKNKVQKLWKDYDNFSSYTPALIWNYAVAGIWIRYNKI